MLNDDFKNKLFHHFSKLDDRQHAFMNAIHVSKKHKILFFHIAKTGGSSIAHILQENDYDDNILANRDIDRNTKLKYLKEIIDDWDNYYKFTFIRNKYDLLKSLYNMNKYLSHSIPQNITFEDFICNYIGNSSEYGRWLDQYTLTQIDNKCIFDYIGKFDTYINDRKIVLKKLNIHDNNTHDNKGNYSKEKLKYNENMINKINQVFDKEMKHFNWKIN